MQKIESSVRRTVGAASQTSRLRPGLRRRLKQVSKRKRIMPLLLWFALLAGRPVLQEKTVKTTVKAVGAEKTESGVTRVPIQAILLVNEDDQLPAAITPEQIKAWVADANAIYKPAKIQFDFTGDDTDFQGGQKHAAQSGGGFRRQRGFCGGGGGRAMRWRRNTRTK